MRAVIDVAFASILLLFAVPVCMQTDDDRMLVFPCDNSDKNTIWVGAILSNHQSYRDSYHQGCGELDPIYVTQSHAFLFAVQYANDHILRNHGIRLGMQALDSCDNDQLGFKRGIQFIQGDAMGMCNNSVGRSNSKFISVVTGVEASDVALQVASLMQDFCVPQIWTLSTTPLLDDHTTYEYSLRTVPSDFYQTKAIVALLLAMRWRVVAIVYEDTSYGKNLYTTFTQHIANLAEDNAIAVESSFAIDDNDKHWWNESNGQGGCSQWLAGLNAAVLLVFVDYSMAGNFFKFFNADPLLAAKQFQFVGADGWSNNLDVVRDNERLANRSVTTTPLLYNIPEYSRYLANITYNRTVDPWLRDLIGQTHNCGKNFGRTCLGNESLHFSIDFAGVTRAHFAVEAIILIANAFSELHQRLCGNTTGLCSNMENALNGSLLYTQLKNSTFNYTAGPLGSQVRFATFYDDGSGPPYYSIFQYICDSSIDTCTWRSITTYDGTLSTHNETDFTSITVDPVMQNAILASVQTCFPICQRWERRESSQEGCYKCSSCDSYSIFDGSSCSACPPPHVPSALNYSVCVTVTPVTLVYLQTSLKYLMLGFCIIGLLSTLTFAVTLRCYRETAVVITSVPKLNYCLLLSMATQFLVPEMLIFLDPTYRCLLVPVSWFLSITLAGAALFAKITQLAGWCPWQCDSGEILHRLEMRQTTSKFCRIQLGIPLVAEATIIGVTYAQSMPSPIIERSFVNSTDGRNFSTTIDCQLILKSYSLVLLIVPAVTLFAACSMSYKKLRHTCINRFLEREARLTKFVSRTILICFAVIVVASLTDKVAGEDLEHMIEITGIFVIACMCGSIMVPTVYLVLFRSDLNTWEYVRSSPDISSSYISANSVQPSPSEYSSTGSPTPIRQSVMKL